MRPRALFLASLLAATFPVASLSAQQHTVALQNAPVTSPEERAALHRGPEWQQIAPHLPNPDTASAASLETAADVLRARRFPEDALDYYGYAMARGGNVSELLNKMGVVRLELQQNALAHEMFLRTVHVQKKNAQAWNNLGVTEYVAHNYVAAISDYRRANKINRRSAVFHSNLGMAYLENKDIESARDQFTIAIQLDPNIMQARDGGGATMHVLGTDKYSDLCFEMARLYAQAGKLDSMRLWLAKASEAGFDVRSSMRDDALLHPYLKDPQVVMMLANTAQMHAKAVAATRSPSLGPATPGTQNFD
jgi:tetratricopeptide (TPR) repeat protein